MKETVGKEFYESADKVITVSRLKTLEEAALKYNEQFIGGQKSRYAAEDFINGAKWQQERSYSEEDMVDYSNYRLLIKKALDPKEWFEKCKR